jgi:hypothetical protein
MSRNKSKTESGVIYLGRRRSNRAHWVFIAIILFIAILVPIYGTTLRYDVSISLRILFSAIGEICLTLGTPLIIITFLFSLFSKHLYFKTFILSIVLLWVGAFLTDTQFSMFGYLFGQHTPSQGYH